MAFLSIYQIILHLLVTLVDAGLGDERRRRGRHVIRVRTGRASGSGVAVGVGRRHCVGAPLQQGLGNLGNKCQFLLSRSIQQMCISHTAFGKLLNFQQVLMNHVGTYLT